MKKNTRKSPQLKFQLAIEAIKGKIPQAELCRQYDADPRLVSRWKKELTERGYQVFESNNNTSGQQKEVEKLENIIGKKEIEIQLLKKFLSHYS